MSSLIGRTLGHYRIVAFLGSGGMGEVYQGEHIHLDRTAAVKVMHTQLAADPEFHTRFRQEARAAAALRHPHIIKVYDFGHDDDERYYLLLELVPDGSLRTLLQRRGKQQTGRPLAADIALIRQAARALGYAHQKGTVHRDIKPDNLLLSRTRDDYHLKVTDFGLARLAEGSGPTRSGVTMGTPAYMSPEQCQGIELDGRSDLYSLGVVLYEVVTGYLPFDARTLTEAVYKHVYTPPPPPRKIRGDLPAELEEIILRCLAKRPEDRFPSAEALEQALGAAFSGAGAHLSSPTFHAQHSFAGGGEVQPTRVRTPVDPPTPPEIQSLPGTLPVPRVRVLDRTGETQVVELRETLTVGREPENDLVLPAEAVSRQHLRITWDGRQVTVTDLGTISGTVLEEERLPPYSPRTWAEGQVLQVGPFRLHLEPAAAESTPHVSRIGVSLDQEEMTLTPGRPQVIKVTLANVGRIVDNFSLSVEGVSPVWVQIPSNAAQLNPGARAVVSVTVDVPRQPEARAGAYAVEVCAQSRENPSETGRAAAQWTVLPYYEFKVATPTPPRLRHQTQAQFKLSLLNMGNAVDTYQLEAEDDEHSLVFEIPQSPLTLEPGMAEEVTVSVRAARRWFGNDQTRSIRVHAQTKEKGSAQTPPVQFTFIHKALIPRWVPPAAAMLVLIAGTLLYRLITRVPTLTLAQAMPLPLPGDSVIVEWKATNARSIRLLDTEVDGSTGFGRYIFAGPEQDTSLTVEARGRFGKTVVESITIQFRLPEPDEPNIEEWNVSPRSITQGQSVTLRWIVKNAESVLVQPFGNESTEGQRTDTPQQTRMYTLIAENGDKRVQRSHEVVVKPPPIGGIEPDTDVDTLPPPPPPRGGIEAQVRDFVQAVGRRHMDEVLRRYPGAADWVQTSRVFYEDDRVENLQLHLARVDSLLEGDSARAVFTVNAEFTDALKQRRVFEFVASFRHTTTGWTLIALSQNR